MLSSLHFYNRRRVQCSCVCEYFLYKCFFTFSPMTVVYTSNTFLLSDLSQLPSFQTIRLLPHSIHQQSKHQQAQLLHTPTKALRCTRQRCQGAPTTLLRGFLSPRADNSIRSRYETPFSASLTRIGLRIQQPHQTILPLCFQSESTCGSMPGDTRNVTSAWGSCTRQHRMVQKVPRRCPTRDPYLRNCSSRPMRGELPQNLNHLQIT